MRPIKFRGKDSNGKWVYGDLVHESDGTISIHDGGHPYTVDPETVGQYTGLKDKNGVEIFEGDILAAKFNGNYVERVYWKGPPDVIAEVFWSYACFQLNCHGEKDRRFASLTDFLSEQDFPKNGEIAMMNLKHTEIIGTSHDNLELLKEDV